MSTNLFKLTTQISFNDDDDLTCYLAEDRHYEYGVTFKDVVSMTAKTAKLSFSERIELNSNYLNKVTKEKVRYKLVATRINYAEVYIQQVIEDGFININISELEKDYSNADDSFEIHIETEDGDDDLTLDDLGINMEDIFEHMELSDFIDNDESWFYADVSSKVIDVN